MRTRLACLLVGLLAAGLSGCAVASVAGTAVDVATTAVSTTADVGASVVKHTARTVAGSDDSDKSDTSPD